MKDEVVLFLCLNDITVSSVVIGIDKHVWEMKYPNGDTVIYDIPKISQLDSFKDILFKDAKIKMRQIKLDKLCVNEQT